MNIWRMTEEERRIYQACMGALVTVVADRDMVENVVNKINNTNAHDLTAAWQAYALYRGQEEKT